MFYFCTFLNLGEESLAYDILEQLTHVERFDMVLLFMSAKEKNGMCNSVRATWLIPCDMKGRFLRLAPRTGKINQNKPAFWQFLHGSPICYQIILTRLCLITSRFEPDLCKIIFHNSLMETNWMQSAILMVPLIRTEIFRFSETSSI